jgi:hypothetical protein
VAAVLLIGFFGISDFVPLEFLLPAILVAVIAIAHHPPTAKPAHPEWIVRSLVAGILGGLLLWSLGKIYVVGVLAPVFLGQMDRLSYTWLLANCVSQILWVGPTLCAVVVFMRLFGSGRRLALTALAVVLTCHGFGFSTRRLEGYRDSQNPSREDRVFLHNYFEQKHATLGRPPAVYEAAFGEITLVWFDFGAKSYFNLIQTAGVVFSRETAVEGRRRAGVVRPFELARYRRVERVMARSDALIYRKFLDITPQTTLVATEADLTRLCSTQEGVDMAVLRENFERFGPVNNGDVYIYECPDVRARAASF